MNTGQMTRALGWFSIGLGLAEFVAPARLSQAIGITEHNALVRILGVRELMSGLGIFNQSNPAPWLWARVGGDLMDLMLLAVAMKDDSAYRNRVAMAAGAVAAVTALDVLCAQRLSRQSEPVSSAPQRSPERFPVPVGSAR